MDKFIVSTSPHVKAKRNTTRSIMLEVLIALLPLVVVATVFYGYHVIINLAVCCISCYGFELLYEKIRQGKAFTFKKASVHNFSCLVTAVILALNLPTTMNIWGLNVVNGSEIVISFDIIIACVLGSLFAIVIIKQLFGGIGKNFINPALGARVFLFLCFGAMFLPVPTMFDATTSATWLSVKNEVTGGMLLSMFLGTTGSAAVGETCVIALVVSYVYLSVRKIIDWKLPLVIVASGFVFAILFDGVVNGLVGINLINNAIAHVLSGGLIFGAVFMATDYATSPKSTIAVIIYGVLLGFITVIIRKFGSYPEGVSFAILIMNIVTPLLEKIKPRVFGQPKKDFVLIIKNKQAEREAKKALKAAEGGVANE